MVSYLKGITVYITFFKQKSAITPYDSELIRLENEYDNKSEKDKYLTNDRFIAYRQHIWVHDSNTIIV